MRGRSDRSVDARVGLGRRDFIRAVGASGAAWGLAGKPLSALADASPAHRANAYGLMGRVLNNHGAGALEDTLEVEQTLDLVNALRAGLDDEEAAVRALVVDALVAAGDAASLRRLTEVARRDVSPMVRQRAREAVTTLGQ
jgi:HEAT repeat protein